MAQSINIKIAGRNYPLIAATPEKERLMRLAAENLNAMLSEYNRRFPDTPLLDKMAFVALSQAMDKISASDELKSLSGEAAKLEHQLESYLEVNENNR